MHDLRNCGLPGAATSSVDGGMMDGKREHFIHEFLQCTRQPLAAEQADEESIGVRSKHDLVHKTRAELARFRTMRVVDDIVHFVAKIHKL
ncbi:hypothetical protein PI124_g10894 [Phytophthora idaei]|nr:hypothetical protein PI124_g10894 [Phytophthora idaei]